MLSSYLSYTYVIIEPINLFCCISEMLLFWVFFGAGKINSACNEHYAENQVSRAEM